MKDLKKSRKELQYNEDKNAKISKIQKREGATVVELIQASLMAALFCVLAPHTLFLPIGPVGMTLGTLLVYVAGMLLNTRQATVSVLLYLALGMVGLPVFSGYRAGAAVVLGPTGGYLIGYLPCVWLIGCFLQKKRTLGRFVLGAAMGTLLLYFVGSLWFVTVYAKGVTLSEALWQCVLPFLPGDAIKLAAAALLYRPLSEVRRRL